MKASSEHRVNSIDALRAISIFGMIFSAAIGYGSDLPSWMFHCQVPPPSYVFTPELRGITWVDLVFPFFLFSMGAVFPFSIGRRLGSGRGNLSVSLNIIRRGVILMAFAVAVGNMNVVPGAGGWGAAYSFVMWLFLFGALLRTSRKWINYAGWGAVALMTALQKTVLGVPFKFGNFDVILELLAVASVMGGLIYQYTRGNLRLRALFVLLVAALKMLGFDFTQYLVIVLSASIIGDVIGKKPLGGFSDGKSGLPALIALVAVPVMLWSFFTRNVLIGFGISFALAVAFVLLTLRSRSSFSIVGWTGFGLLLLGIGFDPVDGGIAKDYCNLSYLFATCGMAALTLCFLMWVESRGALSRNLVYAGRNPMVAYTIPWTVVSPLLYAAGLLGWFDGICVGSPVLGLCRGLIVTLPMLALTCLLSWKKIYLRS